MKPYLLILTLTLSPCSTTQDSAFQSELWLEIKGRSAALIRRQGLNCHFVSFGQIRRIKNCSGLNPIKNSSQFVHFFYQSHRSHQESTAHFDPQNGVLFLQTFPNAQNPSFWKILDQLRPRLILVSQKVPEGKIEALKKEKSQGFHRWLFLKNHQGQGAIYAFGPKIKFYKGDTPSPDLSPRARNKQPLYRH